MAIYLVSSNFFFLVSQKENNKYINAYIWHLEKRFRDADGENGRVDTAGGRVWEVGIDVHILPCKIDT